MAPQALIFTKWFCGKAAEAHYLEGDIIELEFYDSPQIKLTLEDLWFFELPHMHKCFSNTGEPKREELTGTQGSQELCSPDRRAEAADPPGHLCAGLYAALPPAGVGAASPQACQFQFFFGAEVKQKDLSWKIS